MQKSLVNVSSIPCTSNTLLMSRNAHTILMNVMKCSVKFKPIPPVCNFWVIVYIQLIFQVTIIIRVIVFVSSRSRVIVHISGHQWWLSLKKHWIDTSWQLIKISIHLPDGNPGHIRYIDTNRQNTLPTFICVSSTKYKEHSCHLYLWRLKQMQPYNHHCENLIQIPA